MDSKTRRNILADALESAIEAEKKVILLERKLKIYRIACVLLAVVIVWTNLW